VASLMPRLVKARGIRDKSLALFVWARALASARARSRAFSFCGLVNELPAGDADAPLPAVSAAELDLNISPAARGIEELELLMSPAFAFRPISSWLTDRCRLDCKLLEAKVLGATSWLLGSS